MQRFSESLPRILRVDVLPGRAYIMLQTQPGPAMLWGGVEITYDGLVQFQGGSSYSFRTTGPSRWATMSLPLEGAQSALAAIAGRDLIPSLRSAKVAPPARRLARLRRLHGAAGELARLTPDTLANAETTRGLEQALVESWAACLDTDNVAEDTSARRRHTAIMRRFHAVIEANVGEALYVPDICRAANVPRRTLNAICHEALGMGPKRYLVLRRMHLARKALLGAEPASATVTDIATGLGFFDLGRFAAEYRGLFGEASSATLRAPAA